jgi:hypothetical protein
MYENFLKLIIFLALDLTGIVYLCIKKMSF